MKLQALLEKEKEAIIEASLKSLNRARIDAASYIETSEEENRKRFTQLLELLKEGLFNKNTDDIKAYSCEIAKARFQSGYSLQEVYTAFNVLEEAIWKFVTSEMEMEDTIKSLSLVSTVIGAGKESLSLAYVNLTKESKGTPIVEEKLSSHL